MTNAVAWIGGLDVLAVVALVMAAQPWSADPGRLVKCVQTSRRGDGVTITLRRPVCDPGDVCARPSPCTLIGQTPGADGGCTPGAARRPTILPPLDRIERAFGYRMDWACRPVSDPMTRPAISL